MYLQIPHPRAAACECSFKAWRLCLQINGNQPRLPLLSPDAPAHMATEETAAMNPESLEDGPAPAPLPAPSSAPPLAAETGGPATSDEAANEGTARDEKGLRSERRRARKQAQLNSKSGVVIKDGGEGPQRVDGVLPARLAKIRGLMKTTATVAVTAIKRYGQACCMQLQWPAR